MQSKAWHYVALADLASISLGDGEYFEKIRKLFYDRATGQSGQPKKALDPTDPMTVALMESLTLEASKVG